MKGFFTKSLLFFAAVVLAVSCSEQQSGSNVSSSIVAPACDPSVNSCSTTTVTAGDFKLIINTFDILPSIYSHTLHKDGKWQATDPTDYLCSVADSDTGTARDITCILEVDEFDLYAVGFSVELLASSNTCDHIQFTPYYYYTYPAGYGPTSVYSCKDTSVSSEFVDDANVTGGGTACAAAASSPATNGGTYGGTPYCIYDYTDIDGPNCCEGTYTHNCTETDGTTATSCTLTDQSWGGDIASCISGAGVDVPGRGTNGVPISQITIVDNSNGSGIVIPYKPSRPIDVDDRIALPGTYLANYYSGTAPVGLSAGSENYTWTCLDSAGEINARISLKVREWNQGSLIGPAGDPDAGGTVANLYGNYDSSLLADCTLEDNYTTGRWRCKNDFFDWNDIISAPNRYINSPDDPNSPTSPGAVGIDQERGATFLNGYPAHFP